MERRLTIPHHEQDWNEWNEIWKYAKRFVILVLLTTLAIVVIGAAALLRVNLAEANTSNESGFTLQVENQYVEGMLAEELPTYALYQPTQPLSISQLGFWLLEQITTISFTNHGSLIASELPHNQVKEQSYLMSGGSVSDPNIAPVDAHQYTHDGLDGQQLDELLDKWNESNDNTNIEANAPVKPTTKPSDASIAKGDDSVVFIYHTHNRESWNSEVGEGEKNASSKSKNITLVGERLAEQLESRGVGAMVSNTDYPTTVPNYEWNYSYKYSKKTVKEAIASNDNLKFFFDLHRDSQERKYTTAEINGVSYAQVYFIIGQRNPHWKDNEAFAKSIHEKLEAKYPGLSRGIWGKTASSGNAEYNQSLAEQNVLIEVGGVDNTLEESYRTADVLAEIIAEIYEQSKK